MIYRDDYTNFSFNDIESENFKIWITNKNDLQRNMSPNFSDKFNAPTYGQTRYYEGTTIDKQDFKLSCVAIGVTMEEWRAITQWLFPLTVGKLRFGWNTKYYYMVKLSKAPTGTMFIKNRIDKVMGQLYIVEFQLEFTTIGDWAAIGLYGEQQVVGNYSSTMDPSVYNNNYYCPMVLSEELKNISYIGTSLVDQGSFVGDRYVQLYIKDPDKSVKLFQIKNIITNEVIATIIYEAPNFVYVNGNGNDANLRTRLAHTKVEIGEPKATYFLVTFQSSKEEVICEELNVICYYKTSGGEFTNDDKFSKLVKIANPAACNLYPEFYAQGPFAIRDDSKKYYSYKYNDNVSNNYVVKIDTKSNSMTVAGTPMEVAHNSVGVKIFTEVENKNQLFVESGRPVLMKTVFNEYVKDYQLEIGNNSFLVGTKLTFKINNKPIYNRDKPFFLSIFKQNPNNPKTNTYNIDLYNTEKYYNDLSSKIITFDSPAIFFKQEEGGWLMEIYIRKEECAGTIYDNLINEKMLNTYYYISMSDYQMYYVDCDYVKPDANLEGDKVGTSLYIGCQTRDVI